MIEKENIADNKPLTRQLQVKTPQQINKIRRRLEYLVQKSIDVFAVLASDGTIKYIGETIEKVYDVKPKELIGKNIFKDFALAEPAKLTGMLNFVLAGYGREAQGDVKLKTSNGREIHLDVHLQNMLHDPAVEGITVNFRDVTDRVALEKEITYMATHHEISGLPNSVYFKKQLRQQCQMAQKNGTKFALMMLEINGLKYINYSLGYDYEKPLLREVVWRLMQCLGDDIFISHYSGDHFALIVPEPGTNLKYEDIAKQIIASFAQHFHVDKYEIDLSVNIGICVYPNEQGIDALGKQAKIALLRAKKEGKNTYKFYSSDLDIQHYKEFVLRNDLHHAIEKEQFKVYFQPMVNLQTNEILAAEALIRWQHPDWGTVSSDDFIYLAEETGLIVDLGKWVLREVCRLYRQWRQAGLPDIKISVNYSVVQFLEKDFVDNIIKIIEEFKLDPRFLIIEITESMLTKHTERIASKIQGLQSYGIEVALDDFGTGFSSLAYLNQYNIDILKIDGSLIKKSISNQAGVVIVNALIKLAKELKIKMVAEGIENEEQLSVLKDLNCYCGQGYIYGKPEPAEDFAKILARGKINPLIVSNGSLMLRENRRRYFRIRFLQLLEADLTILEINGKKVDVGNTKVLVKNIGPGGLCFISNIRFPVKKFIILQFTTQLIGKELKLYGYPVWRGELEHNLYEYGIEFNIDENERTELIRILNQVQIKKRKSVVFAEGNFVTVSPVNYFKALVND